MIMEFKKSKVMYFALMIITSVLVIAMLVPRVVTIDGEQVYVSLISGNRAVQSVILRWVLIIVGVLMAQMLSSAVASKIGNKEFQRMAAVLLQRCDVDAFFENEAVLLKKGSRQTAVLKEYLLGKGYIGRGEFDKAIELCERAKEDSKVEWITHDMRVSLCGAYSNACIAYVEVGDADKAVKLYSKLKATSEAAVNNREAFAAADDIRSYTRDYIAVFAKESFKDAGALEKHIDVSKNEFDRVVMHHALAKLYERLGKPEAAVRSYRYIAVNGNKLAFADAARGRLIEMGITLK